MVKRTGTGSATTSSSPASLTFNFAPVMMCVIGFWDAYSTGLYRFGSTFYGDNGGGFGFVLFENVTTSYSQRCWLTASSYNQSSVKKSSNGKTIYWYNSSISDGYDASGNVYCFLSLG